jgi:hypothetical protein
VKADLGLSPRRACITAAGNGHELVAEADAKGRHLILHGRGE